MNYTRIAQLAPIVVTAVGVVVISAMLLIASSSPIAYDQVSYTSEQAALCPGDTLIYTNTLTVNRTAIVGFTSSWWSVDTQRYVGPPEPVQYRPFARGATIGPVRRPQAVPDLPPGNYEFWFVAGEFGRGVAGHVVPFTVRGDCG